MHFFLGQLFQMEIIAIKRIANPPQISQEVTLIVSFNSRQDHIKVMIQINIDPQSLIAFKTFSELDFFSF